MGIFISLLLYLAESNAYLCGEKKKYRIGGILVYCLIFVFLITFTLIQKPQYGTIPYLETFNNAKSFDLNSLFNFNGLFKNEMEPFYLLWSYLIRRITDSFAVFRLITFSIVYYSVLKFYSSFSAGKYGFISFMLFWPVLIDFIYGIRYGFSIAFCLLALISIKNKHYVRFVIFSIIAVFTHFLALAFVAFLLYRLAIKLFFKKRQVSILLLVLSAVLVFAISRFGLNFFQTMRIAYRMSNSISISSVLSYAPYVIFALYICYRYSRTSINSNQTLLVAGMFFVVATLFLTIQWGVYRLPYIFIPLISVGLINSLNKDDFALNRKNDYCRMYYPVLMGICLVFSAVKIYTMGIQNMSLYLELYTFF